MIVHITKADGTLEPFKIEKLRRSLRRSGADKDAVASVVDQVSAELYDGMHTQEIYRRAFALLRTRKTSAAARYSLRRALFGLGPTGFPFEEFLARLFAEDGYTTKVGSVIAGACASHEIDVAAYRDNHSFVAEAKFHSRPGIKTDLQVAMYSYARLLDLQNKKICTQDICGIKEFWLITNTKFTSTAHSYGSCVGLSMLSWNYPKSNNLHDRIQRAKIYPVTVLSSLSSAQAMILLDNKIILCKDLVSDPTHLHHLHVSREKTEAILQEARELVA